MDKLLRYLFGGARSEDTLVLIDGTEANDVMSPGSGFDFSTMSAENIERIEIYRGPQSVRFGAGALGGVISITTKQGKARPLHLYSMESGSYNTQRAALSSSGTAGIISYALSGSYFTTDGYSAAAERFGNEEADAANAWASSLKLGLAPTQTSYLELVTHYTEAQADIDTFGGPGGDDPDSRIKMSQLVSSLKFSEEFLQNLVKFSLSAHFAEAKRQGENPPDVQNATDSSDYFLSENRKLQSHIQWAVTDNQTLSLQAEYRDESGRAHSRLDGISTTLSRKDQSVLGQSLTYLFESRHWLFDTGLRVDQSSRVNRILSYRTTVGRKFPDSHAKIFLIYGTGYKLPSLYQLYSIYGDDSLLRENSETYEATFSQELGERHTFSLSVFENRFRDMIDYNTVTSRYFNLSQARSHGFEAQASTRLSSLQIQGSYSYLESRDQTTGLRLLRRPQNGGSLAIHWEKETYELQAKYSYRGSREDIDPVSYTRITASSYALVSLNGSYKYHPLLKLHARLENVFDERYEEVAGYGTAGRSIYLGISGTF